MRPAQWSAAAEDAYRDDGSVMPLHLAQVQDRYRAAVMGFAIGDALGFPLRGLPPSGMIRWATVAEDFVARPRGRFAKGQFSDDTQMMLAVAEAVAYERRIDGRVAAAHVSWLWQEGVILQPPASATDAAQRLLAGTPWMSAGAPMGVRDPSCLSRGLVLGLWSESSPPRLAHDAQVLTVITHKDPMCIAASSAFARAVQLCLSGEPLSAQAFCEEVSKAAAVSDQELADELFYLPRILSWDVDRALSALRRVGVPASQYDFEQGLPAHVTPVLLTSLYAALKAPGDFREALSLTLRCGGELDIATAMTGAMLGASLGTEALPARLRKNVLYVESLVEAADRLFDARLAREPAVNAGAFAFARRGV